MTRFQQHAIGMTLSVIASLAVCAAAVWFVIPMATTAPKEEIIEPEMVGEYMGELTRGVHIHEYTSSKGQECVVAYTAGGKVAISCT